MTDEFIGKQIGGYEVVARLGQGGMATVYQAQQTSMNRTVALKILPRQLMRDPTYLQRFRREVDIVARLEHRSIVPVYDYGEFEDQPWIAMRYMPGGSVDDLLNKRGALDAEQILSIVEQIAPALDYAHSKGVLHRDLKPSNVLMDDGGGAYITDFGIARLTGKGASGTTITTQGVVGTPSYMSPEQAKGEDLDGRSDVYALGVMLFEMATGRRPFESETPYGVAVMQVTATPPSPRAINHELSDAIEHVILKALKKNPDNRYQTASELATSLKLAIERPELLHDTQPRPLFAQQSTQPSQAQQQTVPSPPQRQTPSPGPQPPVYTTPPPPGQSGRARTMDPSRSLPRVPRRRRRGNMWIGVLIGGVIGCGLLSLIAVIAAYALGGLFDGGDNTSSAPTITATGAAAASPTATEADIAPVGALPTADPALDDATGTILYFDERTGANGTRDYDIYSYDLATGSETPLTTNDDAADMYPVASPDGSFIVFQSDRDGDFDIYLMRSDGQGSRRLTDNGVLDRLPAWSPDGQYVVYASDTRDDGTLDLYRVPVTGGEPELLLSNGARNTHPRYSPDGAWIVFVTGSPDNATTWEIARLNVASGEVFLLTDNEVRDAAPVYSPDGTQILFITGTGSDNAIALMPADGTAAPFVLHDSASREGGAYFSPDGDFILFDVQEDGESRLFIMLSDGSALERLSPQGGFYPSWIPG